MNPTWHPFNVAPLGTRPQEMRSILGPSGIGDRLRTAAFAEIQAKVAFLWAAQTFTDAPAGLISAWRGLAIAEQKHLDWLLNRMKELNQTVAERTVSDQLWQSLVSCKDAKEFSYFMARAEKRGQIAGENFENKLRKIDPISAKIFGQIAIEEVEHIKLPLRYWPTLALDHPS